jgi:hypothetical protein
LIGRPSMTWSSSGMSFWTLDMFVVDKNDKSKKLLVAPESIIAKVSTFCLLKDRVMGTQRCSVESAGIVVDSVVTVDIGQVVDVDV